MNGTALASNEEGMVVQLYDYYPYGGEVLNSSLVEAPTAHSFTDKELEEDLGLYYFEARWYDPLTGRFTSLDPAQLDGRVIFVTEDPQSLNFYSYSRNNPTNFIDPTGEFWQELKSFMAGIGNAWGSNNIFGIGRSGSGDAYFNAGQTMGDGLSMVTGAMEVITGNIVAGGGGAGGLVFAPVTGGSSVIGGAAAITAGTAMVGHGSSAMLSGGQNFGMDIRSIAESIGNGHAWSKHVEQKGEFNGMFNTKDDFVDYIQNVMNNATEMKQLNSGRSAYWDDANQAVVIHDPNHADQGTALQPGNGKDYFDNLK